MLHMHRLLVTTSVLESENVILPKEAAHHLKVLRPKSGEKIELFDGAGHFRIFECGASATQPLTAGGVIGYTPKISSEIILFACITKGSRWDWTIEKSVELGVTKIVPVISDRCIVRIERSDRAQKRERWQRIAEDAARQSDAKWLPEILEPMDFKDTLAMVKECECFAGALVNPPPAHLLTAVQDRKKEKTQTKPFALYVGPEGDFSPSELASLLEIATPTTFGPSILRAETAAIFGVSVLSSVLRQ